MRKQSQLGLVVEGSSISSSVLRLPKLAEELGPVKSASMREGRRLSNMLRAGYAVEDFADLQAASLILLYLPDNAVPRMVEGLCASELVLKDLSFVLCESWLTTDVLHPLAMAGASIATVTRLPTMQRDWFAVEGSSKAVRLMRRFLARNGARSDEVKPGSKDYLFASELMVTALPMPLLITAQQALRASGLSGNTLSALLEQMTLKILQDFLRGARAPWGGPLNECSAELSEMHMETLRTRNPSVGAYLHEQLGLARKAMAAARLPPEEVANSAKTTRVIQGMRASGKL